MGLSLQERYQEEALKEGKKIEASILPLARDLRVIERRRSKEQWKNSRAGLGFLFLKKVARRGRGKRTPPYIDNGYGSHNLKVQSS